MRINKKIKEDISKYLESEKSPLICIVGPTGSGKTQFAIEVLKEFGGELLNGDSRQIYKGIEKITGLDFNEIKDFPNHLFGIVEIKEKNWTVGKFLEEIRKIIKEIYLRKKIPILVGGTGLFISSLIEGFEIPNKPKTTKYKNIFKEKTKEELFKELEKIDPQSAKKLHPNNRNYIERALEVFYTTGGKKSEGKKDKNKAFNPLIFHKKIFTEEERLNLYDKINKRQKNLFVDSIEIIEKIKTEIKSFEEFPALKSIGIKEISNFIDGNNQEEEILKMQKRARNYAKRQMTWWRNKKLVNFI